MSSTFWGAQSTYIYSVFSWHTIAINIFLSHILVCVYFTGLSTQYAWNRSYCQLYLCRIYTFPNGLLY